MKKKLALFLAAAVIISCTADEKNSNTARTVERQQPAGRAAVNEAGDNKAEDGSDGAAAVLSEPEGRDFLLYSDSPEQLKTQADFVIGELQSSLGIDEKTSALIGTATDFLDSVVSGDIEEKLVSAEKREFVIRNLEVELEKAALAGYRIGIIDSLSAKPSAAVRLETEAGYTEGMIYFIREGGWKIDDFQADFSRAEKKENDKTEWFPYNGTM